MLAAIDGRYVVTNRAIRYSPTPLSTREKPAMTDRYAVIGNPIAHSKSPRIHAAFAAQTGQDLSYEALLGPLDAFLATVQAFRAAGGKGMNVTVPFKLDALQLADRLTPRAQAAQAVNTLKFDETGILGDNTDGIGLVNDIQQRLGFAIAGRRVLLIGAGGASRGAMLPLLEAGPASLTIANRTVSKASELRQQFSHYPQISAGTLAEQQGQAFDLVINATSTALGGASTYNLPPGLFSKASLAYDMMYGNEDTLFQREAAANGATQTADGLGMLVGQAAESFFLWRGVRPDTEAVRQQLR